MRTDYRQTSEKIFLDMVNYHNRESLMQYGLYPLQGRDVVLGTPNVLQGVRTSTLITPKQTAPYIRSVRFVYDRVPLNHLLLHDTNTTFRVRAPGEYQLSEFIGEINDRWSINLGVRDYIDKLIHVEQYDAHVLLEADPRSLVWAQGVTLRITCGIPLSDVIVNRDLDGFGTLRLEDLIRERNLDGFYSGEPSSLIKNRDLLGFVPSIVPE